MLLRPPSLFFSSLSFNLFISGGQGRGHVEEEEVVVMVVATRRNVGGGHNADHDDTKDRKN